MNAEKRDFITPGLTDYNKVTLIALENYEMWWVKKPLNDIRKRMGWPEITHEDLEWMINLANRSRKL